MEHGTKDLPVKTITTEASISFQTAKILKAQETLLEEVDNELK